MAFDHGQAPRVPACTASVRQAQGNGADTRQRFASTDVAVSGARALVAACLRAWGVPEDIVEDARLVTSELVTNAVIRDHARAVEIEVVDLGQVVVVAVDFLSDVTARADVPGAVIEPDDRGLAVVDALGQTWGRLTDATGGRSWCQLSAPVDQRWRRHGTSPTPSTDSTSALGAAIVALAPALSAARTPRDVERAAATVLRRALVASGLAVAALEPDGRSARWGMYATVAGREHAGAHTFAVSGPTPAAAALREGRAFFHETLSAATAQFPALSGARAAASADRPPDITPAMAHLPMVTEDGTPFGVVGVYWPSGRVIDEYDRGLLTAAVAQVAVAWQRASLSEAHRRNSELLQRALLPQVLPAAAAYDLGAAYRAVSTTVAVGGDWYDAFTMDDGTMRLVVGDVSGHGVEAAAVMAKLRYSARAYALCGASADEVVRRTNRLLSHSGRDLLASMLYVEYDPLTRHATFANAGHPPALLVPPVGPATRLGTVNGPLLGVCADVDYPVSTHAVGRGDALVLYTDGLVEVSSESIDVGIGRLAGDIRAAVRGYDKATTIAADLVRRRVERGPLTDDVCALVAVQR